MKKNYYHKMYIAFLMAIPALSFCPQDVNAQTVVLSQNFETKDAPIDWKYVDVDKDGHNWRLIYQFDGWKGANETEGFMISESWFGSALTPDNYIISPEISGAGNVSYYVCTGDEHFPVEHYAVCASSTGQEPADFSIIFEETIGQQSAKTPRKIGDNETTDGNPPVMTPWLKRAVNLPEGTKYVAFRHYNSTDQYRLCLDEIVFMTGEASGIENVNSNESENHKGTYTLGGMRMKENSQLPAGVYVVNGKKVVVK